MADYILCGLYPGVHEQVPSAIAFWGKSHDAVKTHCETVKSADLVQVRWWTGATDPFSIGVLLSSAVSLGMFVGCCPC